MSYGLHVVHGAYAADQNATDWSLDKFLKAIYSLFKMAPARHEDYLVANDLHELHKSKNVSYLFAQKFCGHRWLGNGAALKRAIEINQNLKVYFRDLKEKKDIPTNNDYHYRHWQIRITNALRRSPLFTLHFEWNWALSCNLLSWMCSCCIFIRKVEGAPCIRYGKVCSAWSLG